MSKTKAKALFMSEAADKHTSCLRGIGFNLLRMCFDDAPLSAERASVHTKMFYLKEIGIMAVAGDQDAIKFLTELLHNDDAGIRFLAASYLKDVPSNNIGKWEAYKATRDKALFEKDDDVRNLLFEGRNILKKRISQSGDIRV